MRCTSCGLPLSPQRTHCPRCGKAAGEPAQPEEQANVPQFAFSPPLENTVASPGAETVQGQLPFASQSPAGNQMSDQPFYAAGTEEFANQMLPDQDKTLLATPEQSWPSASQVNQYSTVPGTISPGEFQPLSSSAQPQTRSRAKVQPGFTIAGLCVLSGGIILMLVYIIGLFLPPLPANTQSSVPTPITQNVANGGAPAGKPADITPTASLPIPTPTPEFPGKTYIDTAQMSNNVDYNTALPSQITTIFKVGQKIFVTFMLHPPTSGAVCLVWYINTTQFSVFPFAVDAIPQHAYSYAYANTAGNGYVNIYWASSTACTDKLLAQTLKFTVNP